MANKKNSMRRYAGVHEITPGLFLSGMAALKEGEGSQLREKGVTAVLSLTDFQIGHLPSCVKTHKHVHVADSLSADLTPHFGPCVQWIREAVQAGHKATPACSLVPCLYHHWPSTPSIYGPSLNFMKKKS